MADSTAIAITSVVVAGVVGPGLGYWASYRADLRRFGHERALNARDDLVALLDDVEVALDKLGAKCAEMRMQALQGVDDPKIRPLLQDAADAFQTARALIARLRMRPHADDALVQQAMEAARALGASIQMVASVWADDDSAKSDEVVAGVPAQIERGYEATRRYETLARAAIERLIGPESPSHQRLWPDVDGLF